MSVYTISIEETVVGEFNVTANSEEEALEIARKKYCKGELVLEPGETQYKQMAVMNPCNKAPNWIKV